jgi:1-acyl-sn-glycerol-3-phosphate acyltransferase
MTQAAACGPQELADAIAGYVSRKSGIAAPRVRSVVERTIAEAGDGAVERLQARLAAPFDAWSYYERDLLAQRVHHQLAPVVLPEPPTVHGAAYLEGVAGHAAIIVANHLSYSDANVIEVLLHQCGHGELAARLAVVAGPKVYSDVGRRFSSLCFGTIKSPQNESVSSGDAAMAARDVALAARQTLATARARLDQGDAVLLFPEGTRSRSGGMQPLLAGVARYFDNDVMVVPIGLTGTEHLFAIGEERLGAAKITMTIARPFTAGSLRAETGGDRRRFVERLGGAIARELPAQYRGAYA